MNKKDSSVDETLTAVSGEWEFDENVADSFDTHVRKSVPFYDEIQRMTVELSEYFIQNQSMIYDLGCSTGETLTQLCELHRKKQAQFIGVELSEPMAEKARSNLSSQPVRVINENVMDIDFSPSPDFVTALFTLQFLTVEERRKIMKNIYQNLTEGGAIVFAEKIHSDESRFEDMWLELFWDFKRRQDLSPEQILQKAGSIRGVLKPLSIQENLHLLKQAGFDSAATFFQWYNWAGFIAVKNKTIMKNSSSDQSGQLINREPSSGPKGGDKTDD